MLPQPPEVVMPLLPQGAGRFFAAAPELDLDVQFPDAPDIPRVDASMLPTVPTLALPVKPGDIALFDATAPTLDLDVQFPALPALLECATGSRARGGRARNAHCTAGHLADL